MVGLAASAVVAVAMAVRASKSIRDRDELLAANEELQRRNVELRALQLAVVRGLHVVDERTQGRLRDLVEETGDELAELVDEVLDDREGDT